MPTKQASLGVDHKQRRTQAGNIQEGGLVVRKSDLEVPEEVEARRPLDLASVSQDNEDKVADHDASDQVERNGGSDGRVEAEKERFVRPLDHDQVHAGHGNDEGCLEQDRQPEERHQRQEGHDGRQDDVRCQGTGSPITGHLIHH